MSALSALVESVVKVPLMPKGVEHPSESGLSVEFDV